MVRPQIGGQGMNPTVLLQLVISGVAVGSIYALVALGFVLIYKSSGILNFAHGEFLMVAAYLAYTFTRDLHMPFWLALALTTAITAALGAVVHLGLLRSMVGKPHFSVVMVTIGLASLIRAVVGGAYGYQERTFPSPFSQAPIALGAVKLSAVDLVIIAAVAILVVGFILFFKYSPLGIRMMAAADYQEAAVISGININRVFAISWAIAALAAAVAGVLLANMQVFNTEIGAIALRAFPAAILGGLDSVGGAILGGVVIGIVEILAGFFFGAETRAVAAFVVLLLVLIIRPYGLFGQHEVERV